MQKIFQQLGYKTVNKEDESRVLTLIRINNPDKSPRWLIPLKAKKAYFLKFYNISGSKARLIAWFFRSIFTLGLQGLLFKKQRLYLQTDDQQTPLVNLFESDWAIFLGTPGPNNKALFYQKNQTTSKFLKIATTEQASKLIQKEADHYKQLNTFNFKNFRIPHSKLIKDNILDLEDFSVAAKRENQLTQLHIQALGKIYEYTGKTQALSQMKAYKESQNALKTVQRTSDSRIPKGLIKKMEILKNSLYDKDYQVAMSHGDFTSWNMFVKSDHLLVYDWELAKQDMPLGFDAFHFIIQEGILKEHQNWKKIKPKVEAKLKPAFQKWVPGNKSAWLDYLKLYLFINICSYLKIYSEQDKWHEQIYWLLRVWTDAISDVLQAQTVHRELIILDGFDYLNHQNYAAINFPDASPELLDTYSDIDLCMEKKTVLHFIQYLENHPLTLHISRLEKSYMSSIRILSKDGSVICYDLIWKTKRKSYIMIPLPAILKEAHSNRFGIKQMHPQHLSRYIICFYHLNNQPVPQKYRQYLIKPASASDPINQEIIEKGHSNDLQKIAIKKILKKNRENSFLARMANQMEYLLDYFTSFFKEKGLIITFSGVDGAGKSTVIEKIKTEIEKKIRKRVILLRHRPSVLPILSAWKKGKEQAEKEAANTLPRQGKNKNIISSLLRFAYYYTDYWFGQFYIYCKYVLRGYIVLYDRYYFDFMVDGKRSNLQVPDSITKAGFYLLMKPNLNFFLYAKPETILQRKQELDENTIIQLTDQYLHLFESLKKNHKRRYFSIENELLEKTIESIMQKFILKIT